MSKSVLKARPFVKWAGGKWRLQDHILGAFPEGRIRTYYEPFLGGGAIFFALAAQNRFERAQLNDTNQELIDTYRIVRDFPEDLIRQLEDRTVDKETFLNLRSKDPKELVPVKRAARFIYLNRTGFNGLYRVNKSGQFNVPFGKWKSPPKVCNPELLRACSTALRKSVSLTSQDFVGAVEGASEGDLVYFDPPYVPLNATSSFTSYTLDGFTLDDQHRLVACCLELVKRGVHVVVSNSDTDVTRSIYDGFEIRVIQSRRNINSKGTKRGPVDELLVVGRPQ